MTKYILFCLALAFLFSALITVNEYILYQSLGISENWILDSFFTTITLIIWAFIIPYTYPLLRQNVDKFEYKTLSYFLSVSIILAALNAFISNLIFHGLISVFSVRNQLFFSEWIPFLKQVVSGLFYRWIETLVLLAVMLLIIRNEYRLLNWIENHLPWLSWLKGSMIDFIVIKINGLDKIVQANDIVLIESDGNYVNIFTNKDKIIHRQGITELERVLDRQMFHRVHRSYLVSKAHLKKIFPYKQGEYYLEFSNKMKIRSSRKYKQQVILLGQKI
jgi:hypothetical protein